MTASWDDAISASHKGAITMALQSNPRAGERHAAVALNELFYLGYMTSRAIHAAASLGVADVLKDGPLTAQQIATATSANPDCVYRLLRALASVGVFEELGEGRFGLTAMSNYLTSDIPGSLRSYITLYGSEVLCRPADNLLYSVRTGLPAFNEVFGQGLFPRLNENPDLRSLFDSGMASISSFDISEILSTYDFSPFNTIADIGGGNGGFLRAVLAAYPSAKGILFDQPLSIEIARAQVETEGYSERCELVGGSFFDAVPNGADAYVLKSILHDFDDEESTAILRSCRQAMSDRARLLVIEPVILAGDHPSLSKFVDLMMMVMTEGGRERSAQELEMLFEATRFRLAKVIPTGSRVSIVEAFPV